MVDTKQSALVPEPGGDRNQKKIFHLGQKARGIHTFGTNICFIKNTPQVVHKKYQRFLYFSVKFIVTFCVRLITVYLNCIRIKKNIQLLLCMNFSSN